MANVDAPRGLRPLRYISGAPYNGAATIFHVPASDSTAIYIGGLVKSAGTANADGVMSVTGNVATGDPVLGVVTGFAYVTADSPTYRPASTERFVMVETDPNVLYEVQEDSVGGALAATAVGNTADLIGFTAGSTATGLSAIEIDSSTATASGDGTQDVLILGLSQSPADNAIGVNAKWLVRLNNHAMVDGAAGF